MFALLDDLLVHPRVRIRRELLKQHPVDLLLILQNLGVLALVGLSHAIPIELVNLIVVEEVVDLL